MPHRPPFNVIDLTSSQAEPSTRQLPSYSSEQRGVKRRRPNEGTIPSYYVPSSSADTSAPNEPPTQREEIEAVDLTEVNDDSTLARVLAKQREDALKSQAATENREGRTTLTATKCAICMDTPTDATTTVCGHMFCHKCIIDSLRYEEERSLATTAKASRGKCPACRKLLSRKDTPGAKRDLIPLQFKLKQPS